MRWCKNKPNINDIKIKRKFLFTPIKINGEVRWLEFANIKYKYVWQKTKTFNGDYLLNVWCPIEFID